MESIDTEKLLALVQQKPVIWDRTSDLFRDRDLKRRAWRDICKQLVKDFEKMKPAERRAFGIIVLKKWTQTRDTWMKSIKKQKQQQDIGWIRPSRKYIYYDQMLFMKKILHPHFNEDMDSSIYDESSLGSPSSVQSKEEEAPPRISTERLIALVHGKPSIWDTAVAGYKNMAQKAADWVDVYRDLNTNYDSMSNERQQIYSKMVISKWTHVRDSWMRNERKRMEMKARGEKPCRPYRHHDAMSFLKNIIDYDKLEPRPGSGAARRKRAHDDAPATSSSEESNTASGTKRARSEERRGTSVREESRECDETKEWNRHLLFFRSLLPSLESFDEEQTLGFQSGVLTLVQELRKRAPAPALRARRSACAAWQDDPIAPARRAARALPSADEGGSGDGDSDREDQDNKNNILDIIDIDHMKFE